MAGIGNYIKHSIDAIRMGVPLVMGIEALAVYDVICANTWFSEEAPRNVDSKLGRIFRLRRERGLIAAPLSIAEIAEWMEWKDRSTAKRYLRVLKAQGWIQVVLLDRRAQSYAYVVAETGGDATSGHDKPHDNIFAEGWIKRLRSAMLQHASAKYDSENVSLTTLTREQRVEFARAWAKKNEARLAARARLVDEEDEEDAA